MKTLLLSILFGVFCCHAFADEQEQSKRSAEAENQAKSRRQAILEEIKMLGRHDWAGEYFSGDGEGVNISFTVAPRSGYVFEWYGCLGLYDRNYGMAQWSNGHIQLSFSFENKQRGFQGIAPELIPVPWGQRHYLIPADEVIGFCNAINEGGEPRKQSNGAYLLRKGDEKKRVSGFPKIPAEYKPCLLVAPVKASIVSVSASTTRPSVADWKFKDTAVTISTGKRQGLRTGMTLWVTEPQNIVDSVRITDVEDAHAAAIMTQIGEDEPGPKIGWKLSTRAP